MVGELPAGEGAPEALATLRWAAAKAAIEAPGPVTVDVQQADEPERQVPASYLEAAKQAIRLSGTEFRVRPGVPPPGGLHLEARPGPQRHHLLTSRIKGLRQPAGRARPGDPGVLD